MMEIIIVVVMLGIMAALAIPLVLAPRERVIASEATQNLTALLGAQKRYASENSGSYSAGDCSALDISIPASVNFNPPSCLNNTAPNPVASIVRNTGAYTLGIDENGVITCSGTCTGVCKGGGTQCN
ncbi:MAG: type II secretion system protein [Candidatus Omnitrophica bacterium]|nr:type II secretion system protein [Candidatus Omnitrophota bacterium]